MSNPAPPIVRLLRSLVGAGSLVGFRAGGLLLVLGLRLGDHLDRAAGLLDRLDRGLAGAGNLEADLRGQLALAEQAHAVLGAATEARGLERVVVDRALGVELARVD